MADPIGGITLFVQQQPTTAGDTFLDPDSRTQQASVGLDNRVPNSYSFNFCTKLLTKATPALGRQWDLLTMVEFKKLVYDSKFTKHGEGMSFVNSSKPCLSIADKRNG